MACSYPVDSDVAVQVLVFALSFVLGRAVRAVARKMILSEISASKLESTVQIFTKNSKKNRRRELNWLAVAMAECDGE
jgi:hypothetical protein